MPRERRRRRQPPEPLPEPDADIDTDADADADLPPPPYRRRRRAAVVQADADTDADADGNAVGVQAAAPPMPPEHRSGGQLFRALMRTWKGRIAVFGSLAFLALFGGVCISNAVQGQQAVNPDEVYAHLLTPEAPAAEPTATVELKAPTWTPEPPTPTPIPTPTPVPLSELVPRHQELYASYRFYHFYEEYTICKDTPTEAQAELEVLVIDNIEGYVRELIQLYRDGLCEETSRFTAMPGRTGWLTMYATRPR